MVDKTVRTAYKPTIGIECHVQLKTATKLFDAVGNDAREAAPNTLIGPLSFGLPGALPVLNREAVHLGMRAAFALGTRPQKYSAFDRKHYFYPDLPLGYQVTQYEHPIILDGSVTITVDGNTKKIGITRAHLEADAGKSTHPAGTNYSLVDLNRAGTPLLEIVSEPDLHSAADAKAYAKELYLRMRYADVSDCNMYYGNMRFDVNVSVSKNDMLGTRTETKNLNSFRAVEKAIEYEIERQIERLEKGEKIVQETRGWDDAKQRTFSQRTKEDAHDYRYFQDPDIPPVELDEELIKTVEAEMPTLPDEWRHRLSKLGLSQAAMETLLEGELENPAVSYLNILEEVMDDPGLAKFVANWSINFEIPWRREDSNNASAGLDAAAHLRIYCEVYELFAHGQLSSSGVKVLLAKIMSQPNLVPDIAAFAEQHNLIQQSNEDEIVKIVAQVLTDNPKAAEDVKNGEMKAIGFLVGQVMKASQGRANPSLAQKLIKDQLGIS